MKKGARIQLDGRTLSITNLDKVFYPEAGYTKGEVIDYYVRIAPALIPHLRSRPLTLKRYPDGVTGSFFYETSCPAHRPEWLTTANDLEPRTQVRYCVVNDLPSLVWAINLASIELHPLLSCTSALDEPTMLAFDLDPGPDAGLLDCARVALDLRVTLRELGLESFPKVSGGKGLHIYVPLNTSVIFQATKIFAHAIALLFEERDPERITASMRKGERAGRVFIDWSQNDRHKTTVAAYSLRAMPHPTVSAPVTWKEIERAYRSEDATRLQFTPDQVVERFAEHGDLFAPMLALKQRLPLL